MRVVTGVVLVVVTIAAIVLAPSWLLWTLLALVALGSGAELAGLLRQGRIAAFGPLVVAGPALVLLASRRGFSPLVLALAALLVAACVAAVTSPRPPAEALGALAATTLATCYLGLAFAHVGALHDGAGAVAGRSLLLFAIAATYVGDTSAYYGGRAMGRRPLAPRLSPKKTREGAVCGVLGAGIAGAVAAPWLAEGLGPAAGLALGATAGCAGIVGDLLESLVKRAVGAKDSGGLLPGHGGLLDRLDSLLLAAPAVYWADRLLLR